VSCVKANVVALPCVSTSFQNNPFSNRSRSHSSLDSPNIYPSDIPFSFTPNDYSSLSSFATCCRLLSLTQLLRGSSTLTDCNAMSNVLDRLSTFLRKPPFDATACFFFTPTLHRSVWTDRLLLSYQVHAT
jgi:hypothetical protein